jgi:hypothetical protein
LLEFWDTEKEIISAMLNILTWYTSQKYWFLRLWNKLTVCRPTLLG